MNTKKRLEKCLWCGQKLEQPPGSGRPRTSCSGACRIAVARWRRKTLDRKVAILRASTSYGEPTNHGWDEVKWLAHRIAHRIAPWQNSPLRANV